MSFINRNARRYIMTPEIRTVLNPAEIASITASIGEITERHPFTAHAHVINEGFRLPRNERPSGNGIPINMPAGISMKKTETSFAGNG